MRLRVKPEDVKGCVETASRRYSPPSSRMDAAVMMLLQQRNDESMFVLIERSQTLKYHRGEIAFAGGRREPGDRGPVDTAVREVWEELSIPPENLEIIGIRPAIATRVSGFEITPVVAFLSDGFDGFRMNPYEVSDLLFIPVGLFLQKPVGLGPEHYFLKGFHFDGKVIWGATAGIIQRFLTCLLENRPSSPDANA